VPTKTGGTRPVTSYVQAASALDVEWETALDEQPL
jgi:hypothetical protein